MAAGERGGRLRRGALLALPVVAAAIAAGAPAAWAHVTVHPATLPVGSSDVEITFRVPNERDNANTVTVQVFFPTNLPLLTVDVLPVAGWRTTVDTRKLATAVHTDDGPVDQVVSDVTWTATAGGVGAGQYEDFPVEVGSVPDHAGALVFKALQTYSSGEIVRWIEVPAAGQPEPDSPAPVLTLTPVPVPDASNAHTTSAAGGGSGTEAIAIAALVLSAMSAAGVGLILWRGRRPA